MKEKNKLQKILRVSFEVTLILVFLAIFIHILNEHAPKILKILESGNVEEIDNYLMQYGTEGKVLLIVLQAIETFSIVLPSIPVYICAGILFGKLEGILVCYIVNLALTLIIFALALKLKNFTGRYFDISKQKTVGNLIENAKHIDRVVLFMCLFPIVPGGMIPILASQTKIKFPEFLRAVAIGSLPAIAIYVIAGDFLMTENYEIVAALIIVLIILAIICFIFKNKITKWLKPKIKKLIEE